MCECVSHVYKQIRFSSLFSCKLFCLWEVLYILLFSWFADAVTNVQHKAFQMWSNAWSRCSSMCTLRASWESPTICLTVSKSQALFCLLFIFAKTQPELFSHWTLHTFCSRCFPVYFTNIKLDINCTTSNTHRHSCSLTCRYSALCWSVAINILWY